MDKIYDNMWVTQNNKSITHDHPLLKGSVWTFIEFLLVPIQYIFEIFIARESIETTLILAFFE